MSESVVVSVEPVGLLKQPEPYYTCEECLEHRSEICCRPADELVVCGGRLLCEDCCDYAPEIDRNNARPFALYTAAPTPEQSEEGSRLQVIANLLEQIIEMNGEACVRDVLAGLPISKFSGPLVAEVMRPYKNLVRVKGELEQTK